jgi:hypothetical protein
MFAGRADGWNKVTVCFSAAGRKLRRFRDDDVRGAESRQEFIGRWEGEADRALVNARGFRPEQARRVDIMSGLQRIKWVGPGRIAERAYESLP